LMGFLTGNPAVRQLANESRTRALMHITVGTTRSAEIEVLLAEVEALVQDPWFSKFKVVDVTSATRAHVTDDLARRLGRLIQVARSERSEADIKSALAVPVESPDAAPLVARVRQHLLSAEAMVPVTPEQASALASVVVDLGPHASVEAIDAAVAGVLGRDVTDPMVGDLGWSVSTPLEEAWADAHAEAAVTTLAGELKLGLNPELAGALKSALLDKNNETVGVMDGRDPAVMSYTVSGLPVMHRGLSISVTANQFKSLSFALGLVAIILSIAFRSIKTGLLATAPTALALLIIYGAMGAAGISLDIGTSMLASLIIGAGVDYAVHVLSAWYAREDEPLSQAVMRATARVGPAVWTNAVMVAVGFFVLTLGEARPLKNVGGLTAAAMIVAAAVTFLVIPVLARRRCYALAPEPEDPADVYLPEDGKVIAMDTA